MPRLDRETRTLLAFAGTCLVPGMFFAIVWPLSGVHYLRSILASSFVTVTWSGTAIFGIGGPLYFLCKRMRLLRWWTALAGGLLGGLLVWAVLPSDRPLELGLLGAASGLTFWGLYSRLHEQTIASDEG